MERSFFVGGMLISVSILLAVMLNVRATRDPTPSLTASPAALDSVVLTETPEGAIVNTNPATAADISGNAVRSEPTLPSADEQLAPER
jgi:hypothetical protein